MSSSFQNLNSNQIEEILCSRLEAVRLMKNINQTELANRAGVSRRTISRMENGRGVSMDTLIRVLQALGLTSQLETLVPSATVRPIERVKSNPGRSKQRQKASSPRARKESGDTWKWGDA